MLAKGKPTIENLETLTALVSLGAGTGMKEVSSRTLGEALGLTQQGASTRLIDLERRGLVVRAHHGRGLKVGLTPDGAVAVRALYGRLKSAMDGPPQGFEIRGEVFTGFGEGGYYVSLEGYSLPFLRTLGFKPFAGTLNLRLTDPAMVERRAALNSLSGVSVPGFKDGNRTFGPVKVFRAKVGSHSAAVLAIERTHYDDTVLEVISPMNLRATMGLEDGDECLVTVVLDRQ